MYYVTIVFTVFIATFISASVPPSMIDVLNANKYRSSNDRVISRDDPTCNQNAFDPVLARFFRHFGFTDGNWPHNRTVFYNSMVDYLNVIGVTGLNDVRGWWTDFVFADALNFKACTQWQVLMANYNMQQYEAMNWNALMLKMEYDMGVGFNVLFANWYCMVGVETHLQTTLDQCLTLYNHQMENNPDLVCPNTADYLDCTHRPYASYCGLDAANLVCIDDRFAFDIFLPECNAMVTVSCDGHPKQPRVI